MTSSPDIYESPENLAEGFTQLLLKLLDIYPKINLALSGGSTPKAVFDHWARHCQDSLEWSRIVFFWGDERCVPPNDPMSNFGMTKEHLFDQVPGISENNIFRIRGENKAEEEAVRYGDLLNSQLPHQNGLPSFELLMLGMGDDGHTASIFPNQLSLWDSKDNCVVAKHPESKMQRVSLSGRVINNARHVAFLVTGKNKAEKVRDIIKKREQFTNSYPSAKVNPTSGQLHWLLDKEAARLL